jgi:hypothetical protein
MKNVRIKKTPFGWHLYRATMKGCGTYGWGNTPDAARAKLAEQLQRVASERASSHK